MIKTIKKLKVLAEQVWQETIPWSITNWTTSSTALLVDKHVSATLQITNKFDLVEERMQELLIHMYKPEAVQS